MPTRTMASNTTVTTLPLPRISLSASTAASLPLVPLAASSPATIPSLPLMTTPSSCPSPSRLLSLPPELRHQIIRHHLSTPPPLLLLPAAQMPCSPRHGYASPLLRVCRLLRGDVKAVEAWGEASRRRLAKQETVTEGAEGSGEVNDVDRGTSGWEANGFGDLGKEKGRNSKRELRREEKRLTAAAVVDVNDFNGSVVRRLLKERELWRWLVVTGVRSGNKARDDVERMVAECWVQKRRVGLEVLGAVNEGRGDSGRYAWIDTEGASEGSAHGRGVDGVLCFEVKYAYDGWASCPWYVHAAYNAWTR